MHAFANEDRGAPAGPANYAGSDALAHLALGAHGRPARAHSSALLSRTTHYPHHVRSDSMGLDSSKNRRAGPQWIRLRPKSPLHSQDCVRGRARTVSEPHR